MARISRPLLALTLVAAALLLVGFRPFTDVQSVCPKCPEKGDRVSFKDGKVMTCKVIGKNEDGWVLERYGEIRFAQFREVAKVDFQSGAEPKGIDGYDQVLIDNKGQTILHGTLIAIEPGKPMALKAVRGQVYLIAPKQVLVYYHRGKRRAPPKSK